MVPLINRKCIGKFQFYHPIDVFDFTKPFLIKKELIAPTEFGFHVQE